MKYLSNTRSKFVEFVLQARNSILMDIKFFSASDWSMRNKSKYYFEKYRIKFKPFILGEDYAKLGMRNLYYDSIFGLSGHQSVAINDLQLIKKSKLRNINTIVDVGANVGFFSLGISEMFPKSTIYSLEPIPDIYKCLKLNTKDNSRIRTFNFAISDRAGVTRMSFDPNNTVVSKIESVGKNSISVTTKTLDDFISKNHITTIDLLTIDTETFESIVLKEGKHALSVTRYILIEVTLLNNENYTVASLMKLLSNDTYDYQLIEYKEYPRTKDNQLTYLDLVLENRFKKRAKI